MAEKYSKAVRDLIPEIIKLSGRKCVVRKLSDVNFLPELENKLKEELEEYLESKKLEELADILEVIYRIAELRGASKEELEALRAHKRNEKGGFQRNLLLVLPDEKINSFSDLFSGESDSAISSESSCMVFRSENAEVIEKHGVKMKIYTSKTDCKNAAVLYQETETEHAEEFLHEKSDFIYYILEGNGTWIVEDREFKVRAGDVVVVPAGKRFWFRGNLKQICVTAPAWEEEYERHVRYIDL